MIEQKNPLILAFIGDAVQTLFVRTRFVDTDAKIGVLHRQSSQIICARAQAKKFDTVSKNFTPTEVEIATRARNAKSNTAPKNCTLGEYHKATALEAVIGYNYLVGNTQRAEELCL